MDIKIFGKSCVLKEKHYMTKQVNTNLNTKWNMET